MKKGRTRENIVIQGKARKNKVKKRKSKVELGRPWKTKSNKAQEVERGKAK